MDKNRDLFAAPRAGRQVAIRAKHFSNQLAPAVAEVPTWDYTVGVLRG